MMSFMDGPPTGCCKWRSTFGNITTAGCCCCCVCYFAESEKKNWYVVRMSVICILLEIRNWKKMDPEVFPDKNEKKNSKKLISAIHSCYKLWDKIDPCLFCKKISAKFSSKSLTECLWREYIKDYEKLECSHRKSSNELF